MCNKKIIKTGWVCSVCMTWFKFSCFGGNQTCHVAPFASISHTISRLSRVTLSASLITACGTARLGAVVVAAGTLPLVVSAPLASFFPFTPPPLASPEGALAVSWRTSSKTRRRRAGKVLISPERRSARAWFWTVVGQLDEWACSECKRWSWILFGKTTR